MDRKLKRRKDKANSPTRRPLLVHSYAFLDINPVSEGHTQVIPKCRKSRASQLIDLIETYLVCQIMHAL